MGSYELKHNRLCEEWHEEALPYIAKDGDTVVIFKQFVDHPGEQDSEANRLANICLAALNQEDDTVVDREWLLTNGFCADGSGYRYRSKANLEVYVDIDLQLYITDNWEKWRVADGEATRGNVLRLKRALG